MRRWSSSPASRRVGIIDHRDTETRRHGEGSKTDLFFSDLCVSVSLWLIGKGGHKLGGVGGSDEFGEDAAADDQFGVGS